ncbi:MAG: lasso RiPP family leader peptide-containing protein [Methylacidiphilaceae bacterium]|nr:lasso RiPP family leader peptide-containing protein [Candidatus Methylacidiphilaceae bacterium]
MNRDTGKQGCGETVGRKPAAGRKPYEAPRLVVHGSVEEITKSAGALVTDTLLTGSTVTTVSVLSP